MLADIRYAFRLFRKAPAFVFAAVTTLALGIGANLAVFTLIDRVILHPLAVPRADRLVIVQEKNPSSPVARDDFLYDEYLRARAATRTLSGVAGMGAYNSVTAAYGDQTIQARVLYISANYFEVLGIAPRLGRTFRIDEDTPNAQPVAMVSERVWRGRFGADPTIVGRAIRLNGFNVPIVGVAPAGFTGLILGVSPPEIFLPIESGGRVFLTIGNHFSRAVVRGFSPYAWLSIVGRLRDGATVAQAGAEIGGILPGRWPGASRSIAPLQDNVLPAGSRDDVTRFMGLLAAAVALTMLVGCVNLTSLLLARVEERRTELAVRAALGGTRWRLVRLVLIEAMLVASLGAAAALAVASWGDSALSAFELPGGIAVSSLRTPLDGRALAVTAGFAIVSALLCGLWPAVGRGSRDLIADLKRQSNGTPRLRSAGTLVGVQVALCVVLVFGAGLFVRSMLAALATDVGFDPSDLVVARLAPRGAPGYDDARAIAYVDSFFNRARSIPGVQSASMGPVPFTGHGGWTPVVRADGIEKPLPNTWPSIPSPTDSNDGMFFGYIGPGYFSTLRLPLIAGRDFMAGDDGRQVAIVSESLGRRLWPTQNPLGHHLGFLPMKVDLEIVGVARDVKAVTLRDPARLTVYVPRGQGYAFDRAGALVILRAPGARAAAMRELYRIAAEMDPNLPLGNRAVTTVEDSIDVLLMPQRLGRALLSGLSAVALIATIVGIYGLIAGIIARSRREIGVRIALGAGRGNILKQVTLSAVAPVATGIGVGAMVALWASRFADRFMYGVRAGDPLTLAWVSGLLLAIATVAVLIPARRALKVDPVDVLRSE